jgi:hypothetical protein
MSTTIERGLLEGNEWNISPNNEPSEAEIAYLFNDIGPLLYVFNTVTDEMRAETLK